MQETESNAVTPFVSPLKKWGSNRTYSGKEENIRHTTIIHLHAGHDPGQNLLDSVGYFWRAQWAIHRRTVHAEDRDLQMRLMTLALDIIDFGDLIGISSSLTARAFSASLS